MHFFTIAVGLANFAADIEQVTIRRCSIHLGSVPTHAVDTRIEGATASQSGFDRHRTAHSGGCKQIFSHKQSFERKCGRGLSAIE
ncbi:Uncharacterised protein [Vibrio cholerae]|nr:Uncharacterised protein [Vibrio cholerae]CSB29346.1 Uncharacterised protein [Vibrio cholerae]CSC93106.1 Uncharacterised protein [Vibrio cholerae]